MNKKVIGLIAGAIVALIIIIAAIWLISFFYASSVGLFEEKDLVRVLSLSKTTPELNNDKVMQNSKAVNRYEYLCGFCHIAIRLDGVYEKDGKKIEFILIQLGKGYHMYNFNFGAEYMYYECKENFRDLHLFIKSSSTKDADLVVDDLYGNSGFNFYQIIAVDD